MLDYVEYINKILEENAKTDYISSILTYESKEYEISVYNFMEAYYSKLNEVNEAMNNFFDDLKFRIDSRIVNIFSNTKIINVTYDREDNSYVFELNSIKPIFYNIKLRLRKLQDEEDISDKKTNDRGELVLRKNDNNYSSYELSIVDNTVPKASFTVAALFYENVDEDLFDLLGSLEKSYYTRLFYTPKVDINLPLSIEFYDGEITIYYTGNNNKEEIMNISKDRKLTMKSRCLIECLCEDIVSLNLDPVWFLDNIYIKTDNYILNYLDRNDDDNYNLYNIFMKAGYGNTTGFRNIYCDKESWAEDEDKYFIYNNNELVEIKNYSSVKENDDGTYTFTFLDDSTLVIPTNELIYLESYSKEPISLLALRGRL